MYGAWLASATNKRIQKPITYYYILFIKNIKGRQIYKNRWRMVFVRLEWETTVLTNGYKVRKTSKVEKIVVS